jgi:hypothetical protein
VRQGHQAASRGPVRCAARPSTQCLLAAQMR